MGFFSFKTADTQQSIFNVHSGQFTGTVYLLMPDGNHIKEESYEGYGDFGGHSAYGLLAKENLGVENDALGIALALGSFYYCDKYVYLKESLNALTQYFSEELVKGREIKLIKSSWTDEMEVLHHSGKLYELDAQDAFKPLKFHLKFSFKSDAKYNDLPPSQDCPNQGFFG